jgi:phosphatidylethanolamine-binding protein (PEBP) family uncharacterized protein
MRLTSPAFADGEEIPRDHACTGRDRSPALAWAEVPADTRSLALIVDDPDAPRGTFTHWLAWGMDPGAGGLAEGERPPHEGRNDFGTVGYRGPCPPPGHGPHRYRFRRGPRARGRRARGALRAAVSDRAADRGRRGGCQR